MKPNKKPMNNKEELDKSLKDVVYFGSGCTLEDTRRQFLKHISHKPLSVNILKEIPNNENNATINCCL